MLKFTEIEIRELEKCPAALQILLDYHENDAAAAEAVEAIEVMKAHDTRIDELETALSEMEVES